MRYREQFSTPEWISLSCAFLAMHRAIAMADGIEDEAEHGLYGDLIRGGHTRSMLEEQQFSELRGSSDLAHEVLQFDDRAVLAHVEKESDPASGLQAGSILAGWVESAPDASTRDERSKQARGLLVEVLNFGLVVGKASGQEDGWKVSDTELECWQRVASDLGVQRADVDAILSLVGR